MIFRILEILGLHTLKAQLVIAKHTRSEKSLRLYVGCGHDKRRGWINIDCDKNFRPDILENATNLRAFKDETVDELECCHLFEHLAYSDAVDAIKEWHRVLKTRGRLFLELPDLDMCAEILYKKESLEAQAFAMMGLFGQVPHSLEKVTVYQLHKYGWTFEALSDELKKAGFTNIKRVPITQTHRPATKYNRDMRLECFK